jgi:hypothetical protein
MNETHFDENRAQLSTGLGLPPKHLLKLFCVDQSIADQLFADSPLFRFVGIIGM